MKMKELVRKLEMAKRLMVAHEEDAEIKVMADYDQDLHDIESISYSAEYGVWVIKAVGK